jgi:hypothetical protein
MTLRDETLRKDKSGNCRLTVIGWLAAVSLTAAAAGIAFAQSNPPLPAGTAPPGGVGVVQPAPAPAAAPPSSGLALQPQPPAEPLPPTSTEKRGFLNDFGHWWDESVANWNAKMKEQQSKLDDFNKKSSAAAKDAATATQEAMKNAADAMVRLPTSRVIEIHEVCAIAGNGAADCQAAATNACKGKGFNTGQPLDVRTAEKCTASLWVSGQAPTSAECPVETVVLRAACQ